MAKELLSVACIGLLDVFFDPTAQAPSSNQHQDVPPLPPHGTSLLDAVLDVPIAA